MNVQQTDTMIVTAAPRKVYHMYDIRNRGKISLGSVKSEVNFQINSFLNNGVLLYCNGTCDGGIHQGMVEFVGAPFDGHLLVREHYRSGGNGVLGLQT